MLASLTALPRRGSCSWRLTPRTQMRRLFTSSALSPSSTCRKPTCTERDGKGHQICADGGSVPCIAMQLSRSNDVFNIPLLPCRIAFDLQLSEQMASAAIHMLLASTLAHP